MAATFEARFPATGSVTASWLPTVDPLVDPSSIEYHSGIGAEAMADQTTIYSYRYSPKFRRYVYGFETPWADAEAWETFETAVDGEAFKFMEGACGIITAYRTVKLPDEGFTRTFRRLENGRVAFTLVFQDAA